MFAVQESVLAVIFVVEQNPQICHFDEQM